MQCTVLVLCTVNSDLTMKHIYSVAPCWIPPSYRLVYKKHYFCLLEQNLQCGATSTLLTSNVYRVDKHLSVGMAKYMCLFFTLQIDLFLTIAKDVTCIWV